MPIQISLPSKAELLQEPPRPTAQDLLEWEQSPVTRLFLWKLQSAALRLPESGRRELEKTDAAIVNEVRAASGVAAILEQFEVELKAIRNEQKG